jgi:hypothetical protein
MGSDSIDPKAFNRNHTWWNKRANIGVRVKNPHAVTTEQPTLTSSIKNKNQPIKAADIEIAIEMLTRHVDNPDIDPLVSALQALKSEPENEARQTAVITAFDGLGILQGAALTYAPYLHVFVSDDPFGG